MNQKKYVSPRRKRYRTKKVWSFSAVVLALFVAVIAGALIERYIAYHGPDHLRAIIPNTAEQEQNRRLILSSVEQLGKQLAELRVKYESLERLNQRLYTVFGLEKKSADSVLPSQTVSEGEHPMEELPQQESPSAEKIGRQLDELLQKFQQKEDDLKVMEFMQQVQSAGLERLPTSMPVRMSEVRVSSGFGMRKHPVRGDYRLHSGMDFAAPIGTAIYAPSAGVVSFVGYRNGYGETLEIDHGNGIITRYAHTSKILVKEGDLILRKQLIARIGNTGQSTGSHLHFETIVNDAPVDPLLFLGRDFSMANPERFSLFESLGIQGSSLFGTVGGGSQLQKLGN